MDNKGTTSIDALPVGIEENITLQTTEQNIVTSDQVQKLEKETVQQMNNLQHK